MGYCPKLALQIFLPDFATIFLKSYILEKYAMKHIHSDVFDKRAVEKNQVVFHDVSYIEVKPHVK